MWYDIIIYPTMRVIPASHSFQTHYVVLCVPSGRRTPSPGWKANCEDFKRHACVSEMGSRACGGLAEGTTHGCDSEQVWEKLQALKDMDSL